MAGKLLLLVGVGAIAYAAMPKKKAKKKNGNGKLGEEWDTERPPSEKPGVGEEVLNGKVSGYDWRVLGLPQKAGTASLYYGYIKPEAATEWISAHPDGRTDANAAKYLALEAIAEANEAAG